MVNETPIQVTDRRKEGKTLLRQVQLVQLRLLEIFDAICRRKGLSYWIEFGTLLGAVRHEGFIPWDDDLDVSMPREDYNRFLRVAPGLVPSDVFIQTFETDPLYTYYKVPLKLRDRNSTMIENSRDRFHQGIFIDIFPYDKVPCNRFLRNLQQRLYKMLIVGASQNIVSKRTFLPDERLIRQKLLRRIYHIIPVRTVEKLILGMYKLDRNWGLRPTLSTKEHNYCFPVGDIFPLKEIQFEGKPFYTPNNSEAHLKMLYGNWKKLPPEEERQPLHIKQADPFTPYEYT
jgi:lipopolysaccharide cholinephosphotransferase